MPIKDRKVRVLLDRSADAANRKLSPSNFNTIIPNLDEVKSEKLQGKEKYIKPP